MKSLVEDISIEKLSILLEEYNKNNEQKINHSLLEMLNKGKEELYRLYLEGIELKIIVKKIVTITSISPPDIVGIFPQEAALILSYIANNTGIEKSINVRVSIYDKSIFESFSYVDALHMLSNIRLTFDDNSVSARNLDQYYRVDKTFVSNAQESFFGAMLGIQSSKYFQVKENETGFILDMLVLKGKKKRNKNYLKPKIDELLVAHCPICEDRKVFLYIDINEYLQLKDNEVSLVCLHSKSTHMYEKPYHKINIKHEIMVELGKNIYKKEDIFMYIINNRKFFELFKKQ